MTADDKQMLPSMLSSVPPTRVMVASPGNPGALRACRSDTELDPDGMPRAWGIADTYKKALREANRQLEAYRAKKRALGDPLADARFTDSTSKAVQLRALRLVP
jgi:hypothetical protein